MKRAGARMAISIRNTITPEQKAKVIRLYKYGVEVEFIAARTGLSHRTIRRITEAMPRRAVR